MRRPLVYVFVTFVLGIILGRYISGSFCVYGLLLLTSLAVLAATFYFKKPLCLIFLVPFFILGFSYGPWREANIPQYQWEPDTYYHISGTVVTMPEQGESSTTFLLTTAAIDGKAANVKVMVVSPPEQKVAYGDVLSLEATPLKEQGVMNPGGFDYSSYQEDRAISATLSTLFEGKVEVLEQGQGNIISKVGAFLRQKFTAALERLSPNRSDIIKGIFLGDTSGLDQKTLDILSQTGIRHCFCVSGLHVGFVILLVHLFTGLFSLSRRGKLLWLAGALLLYAAVTGFYPPVSRAAIMGFSLYVAMALGRPGDGFSALALAGFILLLWDPNNLWLPGFQLSFIAMFSILYFMPVLERLIPVSFPGKGPLLVTIAAQILMLPLIAYYFHTVSLVSIFINTICAALVGAVVVLSLCGLIAAPFSQALAGAFLILPGIIAELIIKTADFLAQIPLAYYYQGAFPLWALIIAFCFLILIPKLKFLYFRPVVAGLSITIVLAAVLFPWQIAVNREETTITFLSVGQGDCAFISTPGGSNILIDAAGNQSQGTVMNYIRPFLLHEGVNTLDYVFISHADDDHAASLPYIMDFFHVDRVIFTKAGYYYSRDYEDKAAAVGAAVQTVETGHSFDIDGLKIEVLYPDKEELGGSNELSMVIKICCDSFAALFTGDATAEKLELIANSQDVEADILKVPHHGSQSSFSPEFYQAVSPKAAVISVGRNNYGHPGYEVLNYFAEKDIPLFRTDLDGAVTVTIHPADEGCTITTYASGKEVTLP
ncbi:MAG: DNA internalization-related competence protein ComEC/Rec2 [Bacillota bacterium]|nr:DNA internalization-related competence protein ComEC/Rec2 [Bacillota bacterium]